MNVDNIPSSAKAIILNIRAPRIVMAVFVGMGLSLSGAVYQGMFKTRWRTLTFSEFLQGCLFASIAIVFFSGLRRCFRQCCTYLHSLEAFLLQFLYT